MCIRDRANKSRLESVLYHLCEALRVAAILLNAYLPSTAPKMMEQLGLDVYKRQVLVIVHIISIWVRLCRFLCLLL